MQLKFEVVDLHKLEKAFICFNVGDVLVHPVSHNAGIKISRTEILWSTGGVSPLVHEDLKYLVPTNVEPVKVHLS